MKSIISIIIAFMTFAAYGQTVQHGKVFEYNETSEMTVLPGVEIRVYPAQSTVSDVAGEFQLEFLTLTPGQRIKVRRIEKNGYEIFNAEALEQWNLNPYSTFNIVMCRSDKFRELKDRLFANAEARYSRQYIDAQAYLQKLLQENNIQQQQFVDSLRRLDARYTTQLMNIENYIDRFARINLSESSASEQEVLRLVQSGEIDRAISVYDEIDAAGQLISALNERRNAENSLSRLQEINQSQLRGIDSLYAIVDHQIQTLQLKGDYESIAKIKYLYCSIAEEDSCNVLWLLKTSNFVRESIGDYHLAKKYAETALNSTITLFVSNDQLLSKCYTELGLLYKSSADYLHAKEFLSKALGMKERIIGSDHPDVAEAYNHLGLVYFNDNNLDTAKSLFNRALEIYLQSLAPSDIALASEYNNLGQVYFKESVYDRAEEYFNKALEILPADKISNLPIIAVINNNLALLYSAKQQYDKAYTAQQYALESQMHIFGPAHPLVATSYNNIGAILESQGDYRLAEELYNKALEIQLHVLGSEHPDVAISYNNLGHLYFLRDDLDKAIDNFNRALEIYLQKLRPQHPDVVGIYNNLAHSYYRKGELDKALDCFTKVLDLKLSYLGPEHVDIAILYSNISRLYYEKGDYERASDSCRKAIDICEGTLEQNYPFLLDNYKALANIYQDQHDYIKAAESLKMVLDIKTRILRSEQNDLLSEILNIGSFYYLAEDLLQARVYLEQAIKLVEMREKQIGLPIDKLYSLYLDTLVRVAETDHSAARDIERFMKDKLWKGNVVGDNSPASERGLSGGYYFLEFGTWNFINDYDLARAVSSLRGLPKSVVLIQGDTVNRYEFENQLGIAFSICKVTHQEKARVVEAYRRWNETLVE